MQGKLIVRDLSRGEDNTIAHGSLSQMENAAHKLNVVFECAEITVLEAIAVSTVGL